MQPHPDSEGSGAGDRIGRIAPPPDLAPFVEALAGRRAQGARARFPVFPTARAELIFHFGDPFLIGERDTMRPLPPAVLLGPRRQLYWQAAGPRIDWFLVQLTALGCRRLLDVRFAEAWHREVPLADCWGSAAGRLHDRLRAANSFTARVAVAVATLRSLAAAPPGPDPISSAVSLARAGRLRSIAALCRRCEIGPRRLHQRFVAESGIGPKLFLSLMRFGRQLESRHPAPLAAPAVADDPEYADDSHAIREFRRFAGLTPGAYVAQKQRGDRLVYTGEPILLDV